MRDPRVIPSEAAKLPSVSTKQVWAWCETGALPGYRSVHGWRKIDRLLHGLTAEEIRFGEGSNPTGP